MGDCIGSSRAVIETMQSCYTDDCIGDCIGDSRAIVEPFIETVIRLPSILVLYISRALELWIGFR
jgi:hypothetical protein